MEQFPSRVALHELSRAYGRSFALHRINLELEAGCLTAVVGDNGAGKTTLLNLLATVDRPTSGEIRYDQMSRDEFARTTRHRIGWISHHPLLYEELTARENLAFFARLYGIGDAPQRCQAWLERVGLVDDADRSVEAFSRGMKQRLTIARALIHNPQLLLLDEPATGLDRQGTQFIADLLCQLVARGRLVVVITHDFGLVRNIADRLLILRRGKVAYDELLDDGQDVLKAYSKHA